MFKKTRDNLERERQLYFIILENDNLTFEEKLSAIFSNRQGKGVKYEKR